MGGEQFVTLHCGAVLQVMQYCFIASAGAYVANSTEPMHVEGDDRKLKAGHVAVEQYLERIHAPYTVFHPLYMYGEHTAKDCEQWFIDRISRGRPVPIPEPGLLPNDVAFTFFLLCLRSVGHAIW